MLEHEYVVMGGMSRSNVGRYLSFIASIVSAALVFLLLNIVDLAHKYSIPINAPPSVLSLIGAGAVFGVLYWILNKYAWRWALVNALLKVPNISGEWSCVGRTVATESIPERNWEATITIVQSWDRIRVRLRTAQSGSQSESAALICDEADGYRLFYSYRNDPNIDETELSSHRGFAEIVFARNLQSGQGEYFNGRGRYTFGTMQLTRRN